MRYTVDQREWVELHGAQCWIIPGREIVTATIGTAGTSIHCRANGHDVSEAERAERIYNYLANNKPASAYTIAVNTNQNHRVAYDVLSSHPEQFQMTDPAHGKALESGIWSLINHSSEFQNLTQ